MNCRIVLAALALVFLAPACRAAPAAAPSFTQPALSPDGRTIAFVSGGDIWSVAASGGDAHLLIAGMGNVSRPLYSPDGGKLAFESDKTGNGDIYVLDFAGGGLTRVTYADSRDELSGWSHDGRWLYFDSSRDNIGGMNGVYRVRLTGGTPMPVSLELYRNEEEGVPAPDDKAIALVGGGWGSTQWWRHGSAHIDHGAIWLLANDGSHKYRRITPDDARALWPMWSPDGRTLYYMSDRGGIENIWRVGRDGTQDTKVTHFSDGRVLWPTIAANGHAIAFVRGFDIWTLDLSSGKSSKLAVTLRGAAAGPAVHHETLTGGFSELALSPDGKKLAFVAHGEVFAAPAAHGKGGGKDEPKAGSGPATRITHTPAGEFDVAWAPNSNELVYSSERDGPEHLFLYDFRSGRETRLTSGSGHDTHPEFSPDGKLLAFVRDGKDLCVLDLASHKVRTLAKAEIDLHHPLQNEHPFAWSPDGRWIAYLAWGARMYRNVEIVPAAGGKSHAASFLGNTFADPVVWSPDGKSLFFATGQRTEPGQIARVDLVPRTPKFREEQFLDLFKEETPPALPQEHNRKQAKAAHENASSKTQPNKPVKIDFDGIARRLSLLPVGLDVQSVTLSPDGKQALLTAEVAGRSNLYVWSLDELANEPPVARQLTSTPGDKSSAQYAPDGKSVYYLDNGKAYSVDVDKGDAEAIPLSAEMDVDFNAEKEVDFAEAWRWLRNNFHDPKMNGVDWNAVRKEYAPQVTGARTPAELYRLLNRLVGELNASHSGVRGGGRPERITGRLGLRFDPAEYERHGRFRIAAVVPLSPAAVSGKIHAGDYLLAIDGAKLGADTNLAELLAHRIGDETALRVATHANGRGAHTVKVKPIDSSDEERLAYDGWVERNRAYVARISHGKLGYVHLPDMSLDSLQRFYNDIDMQNATREGVVVDVRNNYGGFVNAYALDALARRPYLTMTFRGMLPAGARPILGQRALERPTVLVTNRITLSDGEDFTEGYRALGLGKVVGEPTAGWIIYTSNVRLIDGATVRLPFITITDADGKPMEMHPRPVDVPVTRPLGEAYRGTDSDLDAAVRTLLTH